MTQHHFLIFSLGITLLGLIKITIIRKNFNILSRPENSFFQHLWASLTPWRKTLEYFHVIGLSLKRDVIVFVINVRIRCGMLRSTRVVEMFTKIISLCCLFFLKFLWSYIYRSMWFDIMSSKIVTHIDMYVFLDMNLDSMSQMFRPDICSLIRFI